MNTPATIDKIQIAKKSLLWFFLISVCMFFAGLTSAMIVIGKPQSISFFGIPTAFLYSSLTIIVSSIIYQYAFNNLKTTHNQIFFSKLILTTLFLGILFVFFQLMGWKNLVYQNVYFTGKNSTPYGSFFYVLTISHVLHLLGGLISLIIVYIKSLNKKYSDNNYLKISLSITYWHFLGILWLYIYTFLFLF